MYALVLLGAGRAAQLGVGDTAVVS